MADNRGMIIRKLKTLLLHLSLLACALCLTRGAISAAAEFTPAPDASADDENLSGRPDQFSIVVDKAVSCLVRQDAPCFRALLGEGTINNENRGTAAIDRVITTRFIPFFNDFMKLTDNVTTLPTHDGQNNQGLAIFRTFETTEKREKPFVIYIINRDGHYEVGNLQLNVTAGDARSSQKSNAKK